MSEVRWRSFAVFGAVALIGGSASAEAQGVYGFEAVATEITQLFWLADTAAVCGWASEEDAAKFKRFSLRFLSAHLSAAHKSALASLVEANEYEGAVRRTAAKAAEESHSCASARWRTGWFAYATAAQEHETEY